MKEYRMYTWDGTGFKLRGSFKAKDDDAARARLKKDAKKSKVDMEVRDDRNRWIDTWKV